MNQTIFHICPRVAWAEALTKGEYRADSLDTEGFIHCSTREQIVGTANFLFRGRQGLILLFIDSDRVIVPIRYEGATDGPLFPHLYGPLNLDAVVDVREFAPVTDGIFRYPADT